MIISDYSDKKNARPSTNYVSRSRAASEFDFGRRNDPVVRMSRSYSTRHGRRGARSVQPPAASSQPRSAASIELLGHDWHAPAPSSKVALNDGPPHDRSCRANRLLIPCPAVYPAVTGAGGLTSQAGQRAAATSADPRCSTEWDVTRLLIDAPGRGQRESQRWSRPSAATASDRELSKLLDGGKLEDGRSHKESSLNHNHSTL